MCIRDRLLAGLIIVSLLLSTVWMSNTQREQTENELREKGIALAQQMTAVWDFMSANQDRFEATAYAENGAYQGLHCAVAGRSIGKLFTIESDYITRFVNFEPRNSEDEPDEFEAAALAAFNESADTKDYYAITHYEGCLLYTSRCV